MKKIKIESKSLKVVVHIFLLLIIFLCIIGIINKEELWFIPFVFLIIPILGIIFGTNNVTFANEKLTIKKNMSYSHHYYTNIKSILIIEDDITGFFYHNKIEIEIVLLDGTIKKNNMITIFGINNKIIKIRKYLNLSNILFIYKKNQSNSKH